MMSQEVQSSVSSAATAFFRPSMLPGKSPSQASCMAASYRVRPSLSADTVLPSSPVAPVGCSPQAVRLRTIARASSRVMSFFMSFSPFPEFSF